MADGKDYREYGKGTIVERADGRIEGRVRLEFPEGHKRLSVYGGTPKRNRDGTVNKRDLKRITNKVSKKIEKLVQKHEARELILTEPQKLRNYLEEWWPTGNNIKTGTFQARQMNCERISRAIGDIPLHEVSIRHIKILDNYLKEKGGKNGQGLSPPSRRQALAILRTALGVAHAEDRISQNPFAKWRRADAPRLQHRNYRVLTKDEKAALFSLDDEWTPIWKIQLATGNRIGETLALTWNDIDLPENEEEHGLMRINKAIHRRIRNSAVNPDWIGYGEKYYLDKPKTKTSTRDVVLAPYIVQIFKDVRKSQAAEAKRIGKGWSNPKEFVFTRFLGEPITPDIAWHWMNVTAQGKRTVKYSKTNFTSEKTIDIGAVRVHELRHTMITDQIQNGTPLEKVSKAVGHSSVAFTADVYGHLTKEMATQVAESASSIVEEAMSLVQKKQRYAEWQEVTNG